MKIKKLIALIALLFTFSSQAANEWTLIGKTVDGTSVYATNADGMPNGSLRMFLKAEKEKERKPEGMFSMFKKPEKYIEKSDPFSIVVHCKKKSAREFKAGRFGEEFFIPWEPITPGSYGAVAYSAFCKS